jgi:putative endonuclease
MKKFYVYITTNPGKTTFYTGVTNDLYNRMYEHHQNRGKPKTFAGRYYCYNLVYYESFGNPDHAIAREKEIKGWRRDKKLALIKSQNPTMGFLNKSL